VEDEGFTVVRRRACPAYLLGNADAHVGGDDDSESDGGSESDGSSECDSCGCGERSAASREERRTRICKRRRCRGVHAAASM
jgi:hypothetical protein